MRRGINIRKRKRILLKDSNRKSLIMLSGLNILLLICIAIYLFFLQDVFIKKNLEKDSSLFSNLNENIPFSINKIILFSSATAETGSINQALSLDISQFCDIGIYLNTLDKENTTIKSLFINDISISSPELGTPCLYKKRISDLGKCSFEDSYIIKNEFSFNIVNSTSAPKHDNYELISNGSTPIALGFYNKNIKKDFITNRNEILYNGTLLKTAVIPQASIKCNISFVLNIVTEQDRHYICNISFDIPFEDEEGSIYDTGYATKELKDNEISNFIRIK